MFYCTLIKLLPDFYHSVSRRLIIPPAKYVFCVFRKVEAAAKVLSLGGLRLASSFPWVSLSLQLFSVSGSRILLPITHTKTSWNKFGGIAQVHSTVIFLHVQSHSKVWLVFFWCTFIFVLSFLVSTSSILVLGFLFSWSIYCSKFPYVYIISFSYPYLFKSLQGDLFKHMS